MKLKPYPAYKDSGMPWLRKMPSHWEVRRNGRLFAQRNQTGYPDLPILEVSLRTGVRVRDFDNVNRKQVMSDRAKYKRAAKGDIAYNMMRLWQGAVGVSPVDGLVSPAYVVARPYADVDSRFYAYLFRTDAYMHEVNQYSHGIVADRNRLYWDEFKQMPSAYPPPTEQRVITRFLDAHARLVQRSIRAKRRLIELLADRREAITHDALQLASSRSLRIGSAADRVERPINRQDDQVYTPIGLYNRGRGIFHKAPTKGSELGDSTFFWLAEGDLVLSGQFAWEGAVALAGQEDDGCVASHRYPVLRGKPDMVESAYLLSFFGTGWGQLLLDHHSRGAAGRNRPLNAASLMKEKVPIPPLPVQKQITALVHLESRLQQAVAGLETLLREYRTRLIAEVVTGKLDVRDVELPEFDETEVLVEQDEGMIVEDVMDAESDDEDIAAEV